jgi:magnesium chelatase family protein
MNFDMERVGFFLRVEMVTRYQKRISGPPLDRFDIHMDVPHVDYETLASDRAGESSAAVCTRVLAACER